jgi:hypothetical protein
MVSDWLFDTPWWLLAVLVGAGVAILVAGNRRQERHVMRMGLILFLAGATLAAMSWFVDTDKEVAVARTRAIARAVNQRDWEGLRSLLDPNTSLLFYNNRDEIIKGGRETAERIGLKNVRLLSVTPEQTQTNISVYVQALSEQELFPGLTATSWQFNYNNLGTGWQLSGIVPLPTGPVTPDMIQRQLSRPQ